MNITIKHIFLAFAFTAMAGFGWAADIVRPVRMVPNGDIPPQFLELAAERYQKQVISSSIYRKRGVRIRELDFYKKNHYYINDLMLGGDVLFGHESSQYVTQVAHTLLQDLPNVKDEMRFYVVNSPYVNAFATDLGVVIVNVGLLAKLDSEAQLALILAHEISHYLRKHNLNSDLEQYKIEQQLEKYRNQDPTEKLLSKHSFSRELEEEADAEGLFLFLETAYNINAINTTFDLLQNSGLPYSETAVRADWFSFGSFRPDPAYFEVEWTEFNPEEEDDQFSTHPSVHKRREKMLNNLGDETGGKKDFIVSERRFLAIRKSAREQLPRLFLLGNDLPRAMYSALELERDFPGYSKITASKALLRMYQNKVRLNTHKKNRHSAHPYYQLENVLHGFEAVDHFLLGWYKAQEAVKEYSSDAEAIALAWTYARTYEQELSDSERKKVKKRMEEFLDESLLDAWVNAREPNNSVGDDAGTIVLSPDMLILNFQRQNPVDYLKAEEASLQLSQLYQDKAASMNNLHLMEPQFFEQSQTSQLDEFGIMDNYLKEHFGTKTRYVFPTDFTAIESIKRKYAASKIVYNLAISSTQFRNNNFIVVYFAIVTSAFIFPIPYWIYRFVTPAKRKFMVSIGIDLNTFGGNLIEQRYKAGGTGKGTLKRIMKKSLEY